jgi:hypothetical protein
MFYIIYRLDKVILMVLGEGSRLWNCSFDQQRFPYQEGRGMLGEIREEQKIEHLCQSNKDTDPCNR